MEGWTTRADVVGGHRCDGKGLIVLFSRPDNFTCFYGMQFMHKQFMFSILFIFIFLFLFVLSFPYCHSRPVAMPARPYSPLPQVVKASHLHVCTSYPYQPCTCLLLHVKLPFTPQAQSVQAPPFLQPGVSEDEIRAILKRPESAIKALCIPALLHVCPCMCTITA